MAVLARRLNLWNYFALGFGTMIGTGWVILMDDWLGRGGPLGAMIGFLLGGVLLLPIGYVYGQWGRGLPGAAGEGGKHPRLFPPFLQPFHECVVCRADFSSDPEVSVGGGRVRRVRIHRRD